MTILEGLASDEPSPSLANKMSCAFEKTARSIAADFPRRGLVWLLIGATTAWGIWFLVVPLGVYAVSRKAVVEVQSSSIMIAAEVEGRIIRSDVTVGRQVQQGDLLIELDDADSLLALDERRTRRDGLAAQVSAIEARIASEVETAAKHRAAQKTLTSEYSAKERELQTKLRFAEFEHAANEKLQQQNATSEQEVRRSLASVEAIRASIATAEVELRMMIEASEIGSGDRETRIATLRFEAAELATELATEEAAIRREEESLANRKILASSAGVIGDVAENLRIGAVVRPAERLGSLIPEGTPRVVASLPASVAGQIVPGQAAKIRLDGFPWTQFGIVPATVVGVGSEAIDGEIRVDLILVPDPGSRIPISHGLTGTVEILTDEATAAILVLRAAGRYLRTAETLSTTSGTDVTSDPPIRTQI
jgi:multidrug resistance efflux pump